MNDATDVKEEHKCSDCGRVMGEGEAKVFTCCEVCWDKHYGKSETAEAVGHDLHVRQGVPQPMLRAEDADFIWSLIKGWAKEVPSESHSFDPMYFGTTTRGGDIKVHKRLCDILGKPYNIKTDREQSA